MTIAEARPAAPTAAAPTAPATRRRVRVASPETLTQSGRLPHFPGLDGLRGVAVIAVLCFHGGFSWAVGGYLGVSTFFTLSGFLITSLLLAERTTTRTISLGNFWSRRLRRLLPASLAGLTLAIVFAAIAGTPSQQHSLGGDVTSALADVANWHFIFSHQSYGDLFSAPSPVLHFWSLAIEEQFYLLFPLMAFVLLARKRWNRARFTQVVLGLMAVSLGTTLFLGLSHDQIYYGTVTRSFELLTGTLLALAIYSRRVTAQLAKPSDARTGVAAAGAAALAVCVACWMKTPQSASWLYHGGFAAYSILSALVILATIIPFGPVAWLLASAPLRRVGRLSYGVYVYHWPIFLWIDQAFPHLQIAFAFVVKIAITWVVAVLSFQHLERPVRRKELPFGLKAEWFRLNGRQVSPIWTVPVVFALVGLGAWTVTANAAPLPFDYAAAQRTLEHLGAGTPRAKPKPVAPGATAPLPIAKIGAYGDSTALVVGTGINDAAPASGKVEEVTGGAWVGCGLGRGGLYRSTIDPAKFSGHTSAACDAWPTTYANRVAQTHPDLAVVLDAPWDVMDRKLDGDTKWRSFGDPIYDKWFLSEMVQAVDVLSRDNGTVVWLTTPVVSNRPDRTDRENELIRELPGLRPGKVTVLDFAGYLKHIDPDDDLRPDHIHLTQAAAEQVAQDWLIPHLVGIWRTAYDAHQNGATPTFSTSTTAKTAN